MIRDQRALKRIFVHCSVLNTRIESGHAATQEHWHIGLELECYFYGMKIFVQARTIASASREYFS